MSETPQDTVTEVPVQPETAPQPTKTEDPAIVQGGPGIGEDAPPPAASTQDATQYITKDDLVAMERRIVDEGLKRLSQEAKDMHGVTAVSVGDDEKEFAQKYADLLFTDPSAALRLKDERDNKIVQARETKQKTENQFWDRFYQENPVLNRHKRVVQFIMNENFAELKDKPVENARKVLAEKSLSFISDVAQSTGGRVETLSSTKPEALRASGEPIQKAQPKVDKVVNFCDQVQQLHKKKLG